MERSIPIEPKKFGISVAIVTDRSLYGSAVFVLAARADLPSEELRRRHIAVDWEASHPKFGILVRELAERSADLLQRKREARPR